MALKMENTRKRMCEFDSGKHKSATENDAKQKYRSYLETCRMSKLYTSEAGGSADLSENQRYASTSCKMKRVKINNK